MKTKVIFAKANEKAIIPTKKRKGDSAYDLYPCFDQEEIIIPVGGIEMIPTGIYFTCAEGVAPLLRERGSTGKKCMSLKAGVGDANFAGEYNVLINNTGTKPIMIAKDVTTVCGKFVPESERQAFEIHDYSKAIAQVLFLDLADVTEEVVTLDEFKVLMADSERGEGMLGSSDDLKDVDDSDVDNSDVVKEDIEIGQQTGEVILTPKMTELITSLVGELVLKTFPETVVIGAPVVDTETIKNLTTVVEEVVEPAKTLEATETTEKVEKVEDDVKPEKVSKPKKEAEPKPKKETAPKAPKANKAKVVKETEKTKKETETE